EAIIQKLLSKEPRDRFGSAQEVAQLFQDCLAHVQHPTIVPLPDRALELTQASGGATKRPSRWSAWPVVATVVAVSLLVMLCLSWWPIVARDQPASSSTEKSEKQPVASPVAFQAVPELIPAVPGFIRSLCFSPDGEWLAAGSSDHAHISKSQAGAIHIWHLPTRRLQATWREDFGIYSVAFSPEGEHVALG